MECGQLLGREVTKGLRQHLVDDEPAFGVGLLALRGEQVADRAAGAGHPLDQAAVDHPLRELSHRLVGLERQLGERVPRRVRVLVEVAELVRESRVLAARWWRHCNRFTARPTSWSDLPMS